MTERLMGIETEFDFSVTGRLKGPFSRSEAAGRLLRLVRETHPHLPDMGRGFYLVGGRLYVDSGEHPEFCTAECSTPWDVVCYTLSGERLLAAAAARLTAQHDVDDVVLSRCNVDYSGTRATWGCHESYGHKADPGQLPGHLIPHLVSRIIYTGAGGFDVRSSGLRYLLSPRVAVLSTTVSSSSTCGRGIFHTKHESLNGAGFHRLHILCGETLCSQTAAWLKVATTSLVVAMVEAGLAPGSGVELRAPLDAMRTFATDPGCKATAMSSRGAPITALEIQRHYLALAEAHAEDDFMPAWAGEACRRWRAILDRLAEGPGAVAKTLDWAIKLALYDTWLRRRGRVTWESLPHLSHALETLQQALGALGGDAATRPMPLSTVLGPDSPVRPAVDRMTAFLRDHDLDWGQFGEFLDARAALLELDVRFGQLGDKGIFTSLDRAGVLAHALLGDGDVEQALTRPPPIGRARVRGECIRRLAGTNGRYVCTWEKIVDRRRQRTLDLMDPFETEEKWVPHPRDEDQGDVSTVLARHMMVRRASAWPVPDRLDVGDQVIIVGHPTPIAARYAGTGAVVLSEEASAEGPLYALSVDGGRFRWHRHHLRLDPAGHDDIGGGP